VGRWATGIKRADFPSSVHLQSSAVRLTKTVSLRDLPANRSLTLVGPGGEWLVFPGDSHRRFWSIPVRRYAPSAPKTRILSFPN